jgi:dTDP-4-dehydrorhamnose reductase
MTLLLLLGQSGQVGWELRRTLAPLGAVVAPDRRALDLASPDSIRAAVRAVRPTLIVNAAAYTAVDRAEAEPELAHAINGAAPGILAEEARRLNIPLVHYSTDFVFDGQASEPYAEDAPPNPINVYGRSKLEGERAIRASGATHLILRTGWVYGARGQNFPRTILRLSRERETLKVVDDQVGTPTWSRFVAEATAQALGRLLPPRPALAWEAVSGSYHLTPAGRTTWFGFAQALLEADPHKEGRALRQLLPISSAEYGSPARRPAMSCLDCAALRRTFGIVQPEWRTLLALVMEELFQEGKPG